MASLPRVILLGKHDGTQDMGETKKILSTVEPSQIPSDLLDSIMITTRRGRQFNINRQTLAKGSVDHSYIDKQISKINMTDEVTEIEMIVDLVRMHARIKAIADAVLKCV